MLEEVREGEVGGEEPCKGPIYVYRVTTSVLIRL
jgi:hypothetical protein